jgi:hypothetical protein
MLLIIGTYRKRAYVERALASIDRHLTGVTRTVFVDDSGNAAHSRWLSQFGDVSQTLGRGYNAAMREVCRVAGNEPFMFFEEDFELLAPVDLDAMLAIIENDRQLAQLALLRGPHFPIEHEAGGVLEGLERRLGRSKVDLRLHDHPVTVEEMNRGAMGRIIDYISQRGTFTCNPAVWAPGIAALGWPAGRWSEDKMRDRLLAEGLRFGFLPGIRVAHDGERSGHGY